MSTNLKPGPELDAAIASEVMGWKYEDLQNVDFDGSKWSPSTDIAAAWEVVAKLWAMKPTGGVSITAEELAFHFDGKNWAVGFLYDATLDCCHHSMKDKELGIASTLPLAICLAALEAVRKMGATLPSLP